MNKKHPKKLAKTNDEKIPKSVVAIGIIITLIIGWIGGVIPYGIGYVTCGEPPATIPPLAGAGTKAELPGEEGYGPGFLKEYVCVKDIYLK